MSAASQEARAGAERRRWFAAASAAVERRQASASRWTRAAPPPLSSPRKRRRMQVGVRRLDIRVCRRSAFLISCAGRDRDGCRSHRRRHPTGSGPELFVFRGAKLGCERAARTLLRGHCERQRSNPALGAGLDRLVAEPVIGPATSGRTRGLRRCFGEGQSDSLRC